MAACDTAPMAHVCLLPGAQFPPQRPAPAQGDAGAAASNAPNGAERKRGLRMHSEPETLNL